MNNQTKICNTCKIEKNLTDFYFVKRRNSQRQPDYTCKICVKSKTKQWAEQNVDKKKKTQHEYYLKHKQKLIERSKKYKKERRLLKPKVINKTKYQIDKENNYKICNICNLKLTLDNFYLYIRNNNNYYYSCCKQCAGKKAFEWKQNNPEKYRARRENRNKDAENLKNRIKRQQNKEKYKQCDKRKYQKNKENILAKRREKYKNDKEFRERSNKQSLDYSKRPEIRAKNCKKLREKYKNDPNHKIKVNLRSRIRKVLKGINKSNSTMNLLGCSIKQFKSYLESKFLPGMTWENYSFRGWHIDHIIPCVAFNLTQEEEQRKCFHYTNLQPLWWYDNLSKNDKLPTGESCRKFLK
jgi:hypothetical protein